MLFVAVVGLQEKRMTITPGVAKEKTEYNYQRKGNVGYMMIKNKYKNTRIKTQYGVFESKREYTIWLNLLRKQELGEIKDLQRQFPFELIPKSKYGRSIKYVADFIYVDVATNELIVADCKGFITEEFKLKARMFAERYNTEIKILR